MALRTGSITQVPEVATPSATPVAGSLYLYAKTTGLYTKNSAGTETAIADQQGMDDAATMYWMGP